MHNGGMRVRVLLFGPLAEALGEREAWLELAGAPRAEDVFRHYQARRPEIGQLGRDFLLAVNEEFSGPETPLREGDEVALLPPMSGGGAPPFAPTAEAPFAEAPYIELTRAPLSAPTVRVRLAAPEHGAVVIFEGVTRNHHQGKEVHHLEYEAYEPMARRRLEAIAREMMSRWPVGAAALAHRLGRLEIGEVSVVVGAAAPHRDAAFAACRFGIEAVKRSVPIWKKEWAEDGAWWVEGQLPGEE